jgi:hypothetical protein
VGFLLTHHPMLSWCCFPQQVSGAARVEGAIFLAPRYPGYSPVTTLRVCNSSGPAGCISTQAL